MLVSYGVFLLKHIEQVSDIFSQCKYNLYKNAALNNANEKYTAWFVTSSYVLTKTTAKGH